jgi:hypothetical protein
MLEVARVWPRARDSWPGGLGETHVANQALQKANNPEAIVRRKEVLDLAAAGVVRDVVKLRGIFEQIRENAVILTPSLNIPAMPQKTGVIVNAVVLDVRQVTKKVKDRDGFKEVTSWVGDVYQDKNFCSDDEGALTKSGLLKLMAACGIGEDPDRPITLENPEPYLYRSRCVLFGRGIDGIWRRPAVTKIVDLRDGAPDAVKPEWKSGKKTGRTEPLEASALANARRHAPMMAQTKAMLAAFRKFPGYAPAQKYPIADLLKPFVIPCLVPDLDMTDPEDRQLARMLAVGGSAALFPQIAAAPVPQSLPPAPQVIDTEATIPAGAEDVDDDPPPPDKSKSAAPKVSATTTGPKAPPPPEQEDGADEDTLANADEDGDADDMPPDPKPAEVPEPDGGPRFVCGCRCGHQVEIEEAFAKLTTEKMGAPRCARCVPGRRFDIKGHRQFSKLVFPKRPDVEPIEAAIKFAREAGATE